MKKEKIMIFFLLCIFILPISAGEAPMDLSTGLDFRCTTTWGIDLVTQATGFETVINWLSLWFTPIGWKTQESLPPAEEGEPYFYFTVTGLDLKIIDFVNEYGTEDPGNIEYNWLNYFNLAAKLIVSRLWFGVIFQGDPKYQIWHYDKFISNRALIGSRTTYRALRDGGMGSYTADEGNTIEYWTEKHRDLFNVMYETSGRVLIGYDHELFSLIGKIGSRYSWTDNLDQEYAFGLDATLMLIPGLVIGLDAYGTTYVDSSGDPMFSAKATYDIPFMGALNLQPFVCFDGQPTVDGMNMEVAGGINIPWTGGGYKVDPIYILMNGSTTVETESVTGSTPQHRYTKKDTFGGLTFGASCFFPDTGEDPKTLLDFSVYEAEGDEGLLLDVGLVVSAQLYNFLKTPEYGIGVYWDYEILDDMLRPMAAFQYQNYDEETYEDAVDNLDIHVGIHYIDIPNTTIGLEYETGNLFLDEPEWGTIYIFLSLVY